MDKQLAQHRTQEQGSRIAAAAHLNYELAMYRHEYSTVNLKETHICSNKL